MRASFPLKQDPQNPGPQPDDTAARCRAVRPEALGGSITNMLTRHQRLRAHAAVGFVTQWFHYELSRFLSLAEFTECALKDEQIALQSWLDAHEAGSAAEEADGLFLYLDDASDLKHVFPDLARGALVVAIVALFEAYLARQARAAGVWSGCAEKADDLRGLQRNVDFLETRASVRLPKQSDYWQGMRAIEKLRHLLVHSEGRVPEHNPGLRSSLEREGISIGEHGRIVLTRSSIVWVTETLGTLANEIDAAIRSSIGVPSEVA